MRRMILLAAAFLCGFLCCRAQSASELDRILGVMGADVPEDADSYEVDRLADLAARPLDINLASAAKMAGTGLFTRYQIASLADYRARHGDVFSLAELASVDGFGEEFVRRIAPFISLDAAGLPGKGSSDVHNDLSVKTAFRHSRDIEGMSWNYGMRYRVEAGDRFGAGIGASRSYGAARGFPDACSGYAVWHFRRIRTTLLAGDFNARFGQGLALWNGMSMSGVSAPSSIARRPSGISRSWSYTGSASLTGMALECTPGQFSVSALVAVPGVRQIRTSPGKLGLMPAVNLCWTGRNGQVGLTHYAEFSGMTKGTEVRIPDMKTSADAELCIRGTDIFSEVSFDWVSGTAAALAGTVFPVGETLRMAAMLRYYPVSYASSRSGAVRSTTECSNEYAASFCGEFFRGKAVSLRDVSGFMSSVRTHTGTFSIDAAFFPEPKDRDHIHSMQIKAQVNWQIMLSESWRVKLRLSERVRSWGDPFRTDIRADILWQSSGFNAALRMNALKCRGLGLLGYAEGGYANGKIAFWIRQGAFRIDRWEDRIYAYERDAPGSFSVPAYYGRGLWTAAVANWRFSRRGRLYFRTSYISYPFMDGEKKKSGKAELKLQCVFAF